MKEIKEKEEKVKVKEYGGEIEDREWGEGGGGNNEKRGK
jgi:hypothetical protein